MLKGPQAGQQEESSASYLTIFVHSSDMKERRKVNIKPGTFLSKVINEMRTCFPAFKNCERFFENGTNKAIGSVNEMATGGSYVFCQRQH
jgi:hypothetical protein